MKNTCLIFINKINEQINVMLRSPDFVLKWVILKTLDKPIGVSKAGVSFVVIVRLCPALEL